MDETDTHYSAARYFWLLFIPTAAIIAFVLVINHQADVARAKSAAIAIERAHLSTLSHALNRQLFRPILTDLLTLAEDSHLRALLDRPSADALDELSDEIRGFARNKQIYDQIRYLDASGQEVVRVNLAGNDAERVPTAKLQNKADRYYFIETIKLGAREVYVSPFDLNVEHDAVEQPLKPMIRIGTPVFDSQGHKRGILSLNYFGQEVLDMVDSHNQSQRQMLLINDDGYWLKGPSLEEEWGFMLPERQGLNFAQRFPDAWPGVRDQDEYQQILPQGLIASLKIAPFTLSKSADSPSWTLVSFLPTDNLLYFPLQNLPNRLIVGGLLLVLVFAAALALSRALAQRARTHAALKRANARQRALIEQLQQAQAQLVQSEKMAAIGQLAAGVAHEINNPVGFVASNINALYDYANQLLSFINTLDAQFDQADSLERLHEQFVRAKQAQDLDYLRQDLPPLLAETQDGIARIKGIVADLKGFARASDGQWQSADLHQAIESTLNLVWNELKYHCTVDKQLDPIPEVECIVSEINQVIMNLLVNAAQAIETRGTITLRTGREDDEVWIEVEDDGKGIAKEHLHRLFEPFFTTKPVGKGTGLGLSIAYGIIKKHHGRLSVTSQEGKGSLFRIILPISQPQPTPEEVTAVAAGPALVP